jgi:hypothetical protein
MELLWIAYFLRWERLLSGAFYISSSLVDYGRINLWHIICIKYTLYLENGTVKGVGCRQLACWDCVFESHLGRSYLSLVSVVCCQAEVSAWCWSLVQRSPTECGVSECDREVSTMRPWPTGGCCAIKKHFWKMNSFHFMSKYSVVN